MSLKTLLEAAEFLESREQGALSDGSGSSHNVSQFVEEGNARTNSGEYMHPALYNGFTMMRAGTREVHNKLEKNRRAHLKECFDFLKKNIPSLEDKRTSNLGILHSSLRYIQTLKRKEQEYELEMQKFAHEKIMLQERITGLKNELHTMNIDVDTLAVMNDQDYDTNSTSTASEGGTPPPSDHDSMDDDEEEAEMVAMETNSPTIRPKKRKLSSKKDAPNNISVNHRHLIPQSAAAIASLNIISKPAFPNILKSPPKEVLPVTSSLSEPVNMTPEISTNQGPNIKMMFTSRQTPVTQLLHQTLSQRQAKMKQTTPPSKESTAPLTAAHLKLPPLLLSPSIMSITTASSSMPSFLSMTTSAASIPSFVSLATSASSMPSVVFLTNQSLMVKDFIISPVSNVTSSAAGVPVSASHITSSANVPVSPFAFPYYMTSLQKLAHPVLVTSLMAPAVGQQTSPNTLPPTSSRIPIAPTYVETSKSALHAVNNNNTNRLHGNNLLSMALPTKAETLTMSSAANFGSPLPVRSIFAPSLLPGQLALPFLTFPRSTVVVPSSSSISTTYQNASAMVSKTTMSQLTSQPLVSLAQLNQVTGLTPMTVKSTQVQMDPTSNLTQAQRDIVFTSSMLKQFQVPWGLPTTLLQSGQVLGQQLVKPVIVVSVPNVTQCSRTIPTTVAVVTSSL